MISQDTTRRPTTAAEALTPGLGRQLADLRSREIDVRAHAPGAVHRFRVATRRLRSDLSGFEPLLDARTCRILVDDLQRTARAVGPAQDAVVVRRQVDALFAGSEGAAAARVHGRLGQLLEPASQETWQRAIDHLDDPAYDELTRGLDRLADLPPWLPAAHRPADEVLVPLLRSEWSRFRRRARAALDPTGGATADDLLHEARKASKRARYVAESLTEVLGRRARRLAKTAKHVQRELGDHQDRVLVHEFLVDAPLRLELDGEEARILASVRDAQAVALEAARDDLRRVLRDADRPSLRAWMR